MSASSGVRSLYLINKHGSLLFEIDVTESAVSSNDKIRIASILHSISAIASQVSPDKSNRVGELAFLKSTGIERITSTNLSIYTKSTLTGLKLVLVVDSSFPPQAAEDILAVVYTSYADCVLKDPFYVMDMPIRCSLFDRAIRQILAINASS